MTDQTRSLFEDLGAFMDRGLNPPHSSETTEMLLTYCDRLTLEHILGRFLGWIQFQRFPSQRLPLEVPGISEPVTQAVISRSTELGSLLVIEDGVLKFRDDVSTEVRDELSLLARDLRRQRNNS